MSLLSKTGDIQANDQDRRNSYFNQDLHEEADYVQTGPIGAAPRKSKKKNYP